MRLTFLGTRGEIEARTRRHRMHSSLLVSYRSAKVMIDCGLDWLGKFERLHPDAIVLTHAHPDHAWGLKNGVSRAIITHCGSEIVAGDENAVRKTIAALALAKGIDVQIAHDRTERVMR